MQSSHVRVQGTIVIFKLSNAADHDDCFGVNALLMHRHSDVKHQLFSKHREFSSQSLNIRF